MQKLFYVTGNKYKAEQVTRHFTLPYELARVDLPEIQSLDVKEVALHKARHAFTVLKEPCFIDDFSIVYTALGRLPGPLIKWFIEELEVEGLCRLLDGFEDRSAVVQSAIAYADRFGTAIFYAERRGSIALEPRGPRDFGSTSIFVPEGWTKTWAEMDDDEQTESSLRRPALQELQAFLVERQKRTPQS